MNAKRTRNYYDLFAIMFNSQKSYQKYIENTHLSLLTETHEYYFGSLKHQIFINSRWRHPPKTISPRPYCRSRRGRNGLGSETTDDTTLFCNFDNIRNNTIINTELEKVYGWLCSNKLSLNVGKTKYMCFHTAQKKVIYPDLKINNNCIDRVSEFNFLGLIISSDLKWNKHIEHISLKISKVIGIMFRMKYILPSGILHTIYNTLIMPHYSYCLLTWGSKIHIGHRLLLLQKKALRMINDSHYIAHTEPICKKLQIVKISDLFRITVWKFYYKLTNTLLPSYFNQMMPTLPVICNYYGVRNPKFYLPSIKHSFAEQQVQYCLIKLLNEDRGRKKLFITYRTKIFVILNQA